MKTNQIIFLLLFISFSSCHYIQKKADNPTEGINKPVIHKSYYEKSGALKSEITIKNKKKNGPAKKYYATGELHTLVNYVDNIKEGETIWYYKNDQPYRVTPYVNGKMEGIRKVYYENGKLQAEIPYKNGNPFTGLKEYNKNGKLITNYPKIIFKTKDLIKSKNKFVLCCQLSNNSKNVDFYQEFMDKVGNKQVTRVRVSKPGVGEIEFYAPARIEEKRTIVIHAHTKSIMGNPYITKASYQLNLNTY